MSATPERFDADYPDSLRAVSPLLELIASQAPLAVQLTALALFVERWSRNMRCSVLLADPTERTLHLGAAPNLPAAYSSAIDGAAYLEGAGSCGTAAARRTMVIVADIERSPLWKDWRELALAHGLAACWSTPLLDSGGELLGTFAMYYTEPREPNAHEIELLKVAGPLATMVIERDRSLQRLRASEARYRELAETFPDAILAHVDGRISYANSAAARLLRAGKPSELVGRALEHCFEPESRPAIVKHRRGMLAARLKRLDGSDCPIEATASVHTADGRATTVLVCRDVSERKTLEGEIIDAASREQESLGYDLHDSVGQQLTGASLLLRSLQATARSAAPELVADLDEVNALVVTTIEEIRALATGLSPVALERAGLSGALTTLAATTQSLYRQPVTVKLGAAAESELSADRAMHLYRIAQEAVHNAIRHASAKRIEIELTRRGQKLALSIADDGVGLGAESTESTGLGLRSMRYRAERLGGTLRFEAVEPHGVRVRVDCPAAALAPATRARKR
jgi:PAS domain S-box-containing protein